MFLLIQSSDAIAMRIYHIGNSLTDQVVQLLQFLYASFDEVRWGTTYAAVTPTDLKSIMLHGKLTNGTVIIELNGRTLDSVGLGLCCR